MTQTDAAAATIKEIMRFRNLEVLRLAKQFDPRCYVAENNGFIHIGSLLFYTNNCDDESEYQINLRFKLEYLFDILHALLNFLRCNQECFELITKLKVISQTSDIDMQGRYLPHITILTTLEDGDAVKLMGNLQLALRNFNLDEISDGATPHNCKNINAIISYNDLCATLVKDEAALKFPNISTAKISDTPLPIKYPERIFPKEAALLCNETYRQILAFHEKNPQLVKISRKASKEQEVAGLQHSILFDQKGNSYALYAGEYRVLGEGGYGRVKLAQDICTKKWCAAKIMQISDYVDGVNLWENEADIEEYLGSLQGRAKNSASGKGYIIQKLYKGKELFHDLCDSILDANFVEVALLKWVDTAIAALKPVQYVHQKMLIHRDIKTDNFIQQANGQCVLIDYGLAIKLPFRSATYIDDDFKVIPNLFAPELSNPSGSICSQASDMFSFGIMLKESFKIIYELFVVMHLINKDTQILSHKIKNNILIPLLMAKASERLTAEALTFELNLFRSEIIATASEVLKSNDPAEHFFKCIMADDILELKKILLNKPNIIDYRNAAGHTCLHLAALSGKIKMINLLISYGVNVDAKSNAGSTARDIAQEARHFEILKLLPQNLTPTLRFSDPTIKELKVSKLQSNSASKAVQTKQICYRYTFMLSAAITTVAFVIYQMQSVDPVKPDFCS